MITITTDQWKPLPSEVVTFETTPIAAQKWLPPRALTPRFIAKPAQKPWDSGIVSEAIIWLFLFRGGAVAWGLTSGASSKDS